MFLVVVATGVPACSDSVDDAAGGVAAEPSAGTWRTWVLSSPAQVKVPAPPKAGSEGARSDTTELRELADNRTPRLEERIHHWGDYPATEPWTRLNLELVAEHRRNPPQAARTYALVSAAVNDAVVAAWHWKYVYDRRPPRVPRALPPGPDPSYPSEHAALAGAASRVLAHLFPERSRASFDELAEEAADSRVWAGTNFRSDVEAGLTLGRDVAEAVIARARSDGSDRRWDGSRPRGPGFWEPPPGADPAAQPVEPLAGTWRTWVVPVADVRPGPPPPYGSSSFVAEARDVIERKNHLTPAQKQSADEWEAGPGTAAPPGHWNKIALDQARRSPMSTPRLARAFALLNVAQADAGVAAWDCKYAYWSPRPVNASRELGLDPTWQSYLPTPLFPAYVSGHSTFSAAAAEVLAHVFPRRAGHFRSLAEEAGISRLYGGIHYESDNRVGLRLGKEIGRRVIEVARHDRTR